MKTTHFLSWAACFIMLLLCSCQKEMLSDIPDEEVKGNSQLMITTRSGDPSSTTVAQSRVYIFSAAGSCVCMLSTTESSATAEDMAAGTYTIYAVGGDDLTKYTLPEQENATAESVIQVATGKTMGDLLMTSATVTLTEGEDRNQNLAMNRKVFSLDNITIRQVPVDVTGVEVALEPMYTKVKLDGTFVDETSNQRFALTNSSYGTWTNSTTHMLFPSKGNPSIVVYFTRGDNTKSYAYTASEPIEANHHFTVDGTYTEAQGVSLVGVISGVEWGEDRTITFDFDETNVSSGDNNNTPSPSADPVAGSAYDGYYVVSVDDTHRTAVLLAKNTVSYTANNNYTQAQWKTALNDAMSTLAKPSVAPTESAWRVPTLAECSIFLVDESVTTYTGNDSPMYFCLKNDDLVRVFAEKSNETYTVSDVASIYNGLKLRPVIDITY